MKRITLAHGGGGRVTRNLLKDIFYPLLDNEYLRGETDAAVLPASDRPLAFTTDAHVVNPLFFPGGDIGRLAVYGTANDLAVMGAEPQYLTLGCIIEEGMPVDDLKRVVASIADAARDANVKVVAGDTKVVGTGAADGLFLCSAGVGTLLPHAPSGAQTIQPSDAVIVSGPIGDHGATIFAARQSGMHIDVISDCAPIFPLVQAAMKASSQIRVMRDPTRGGLAAALNEFIENGSVSIELNAGAIPVRPAVQSLCDLMGFEPMHLACEGRLVIIVAAEDAEAVLQALRSVKGGESAAIIGRVDTAHPGMVYQRTPVGGKRIVDMPSGELLPRIC